MRIRTRWTCTFAGMLALVAVPRIVTAQFPPPPEVPALGEDYHIEASGQLWLPTSTFVIASESFGILGDDIDAGRDLGIDGSQRFQELRIVLRPAPKHKFKIQYSPLTYQASTTLTREFVFNGLRYRVGVPVETSLEWKTWRLGYEYDFIRRDRGYAGFMLDVRAVDSRLQLDSPLGLEYARAQLPVPAIGFSGRGYPVNFLSITGEVSFLKVPEADDYSARYVDVDVYTTVNFTRWVGVQVGYHHYDINYRYKQDRGDINIGGAYFSGVVRY